MNVNNAHFIADAKLLLPWRATGRLSVAEVDVIERALALAPELEDDLAAARLERQAIIAVNDQMAVGALTPQEAYRAIDLDAIVLLLGMMIVVAHLKLSGFRPSEGGRV